METSLSRKEKTTIRNKIIKEKTHWKRQMQKKKKKAADHTLINQVERLKDKSSKIMHIYNR